MDNNIKIIEKPDSVEWSAIKKVIEDAHAQNKENGIVLKTASLNEAELIERASHCAEKWTMFIALADNKIVGCSGVSIKKKKAWYATGRVGYFMMTAVLPEYRGNHLNTRFGEIREKWLLSNAVDTVFYDTAEYNTHKITIDKAHGFKSVDFFAPKGVDHYSVMMCKWLKGNAPSQFKISTRFFLQKLKIKLLYKKGGSKRFI